MNNISLDVGHQRDSCLAAGDGGFGGSAYSRLDCTNLPMRTFRAYSASRRVFT
jgi:hypothetical protein